MGLYPLGRSDSFPETGKRRDPSAMRLVSPTSIVPLAFVPVRMRSGFAVLLLVGLLLGPSSLIHAQEGPEFGLTLGVNRVTLQSPGAELGSYFAFSGGVVLRQHVYGPASIQAELFLNQQGARISSEEGGAIDYGAGYLDLPLLLHLQAPRVQSITLYGEAGGFGGLKVFERQTPGGGDINVAFDTGTSFYRRLNAGVIAGVGAMIPIWGSRLNLTLRRGWGVRDVAQDVTDQPFSEAPFPPEGETRTWSLLLRFGF